MHIAVKICGIASADAVDAAVSAGAAYGGLVFHPKSPRFVALDQAALAYHEIDIALDPFPFNGTTTTFEALWMGVPVIALRGDRHSARVGASILANAGLAGLVAGGIDEYVSLAVRLASNAERLRELRRTIRDRVAASPLRDAPGFTRTLENAYRDMWARWPGPSSRGRGRAMCRTGRSARGRRGSGRPRC